MSNWWTKVPAEYRLCMARNLHRFHALGGGSHGSVTLTWYRCELCATDRLTTIDAMGNVEHTYSRPTDYVRPEMLTAEDRRQYILYITKKNNKQLPKLDIDKVDQVFGMKWSKGRR